MSLPTVIANNQTAGAIVLDRLGITVPASGASVLTDFAFVDEILEDDSLHQAIVDDEILLDFGEGEISKGDSLKFFQIQTLEVRRPVRALADANVASLSGTTTLDSVALAVDDRVVLTAQTTGSENGVWVVRAGAWARPTDFEVGDSAASALISVQEGAVYGDQVWQVTTNTGSDIIGTDPLALQQISGGGGGGGGAQSLQAAYDGGNTITTAASTDIAFTLTSGDFTVDAGSVLLGGSTALTAFNVDAGLMSLDSTDTTNLTMTANDAGTKVLTVAATNGGAGISDIQISSDGTTFIDADSGVEINSTGGAINVGNDADTGAINVGTGAAARVISIGNATGATQINMDSGTGGTLIDSTGVISLDGVGNSNFTTDTGDLDLQTTTSGAINLTSAGAIDAQATGAVTIDSSGGTIGIGTDDDDFAINVGTSGERVVTIGNNTGTTGVAIETGSGNLLIDAPITTLTGNLTVQGTTTTVESEIVNIADNFLYLNDGYTTPSGQAGGTVTNFLPTATTDTVNGAFTASGGGNATVVTTGSATFAAGDYIQVSTANDQQNDGLYEVLTHVGTLLTIRGVGGGGAPTYDFVQNDFVTDATVAGAITKVNVGVDQVSATGVPQFGAGSDSTTLVFNDYITSGTLTLQSAYDGGNTITTAGGTNAIIAGTDALQITSTGGLDVDTVADFDVTSFDVQMTGDNGFSIDGTADSNLTVTNTVATTDVTNSIGAVNTGATSGDATVDITASSTNGSGIVEIQADEINIGTDAAASVTTIGNTTGASGVVIDSGTEGVEIDGVTHYGTGAGLPTATASGFQEGDKYFDTTLEMEMRYDAARGKWLSVEAMYIQFGRNGNVGAGQYFRAIDRRVMSATLGYRMPSAGTIVGLGYTRTDSDAATFDVVEGGTSRATLATAAVAGGSNALDGDFSANGILAVQNQAGGNTVSNVMAWVKVRFRSV